MKNDLALNINMLNGSSFPITIKLEQNEDIIALMISPLSIAEISSIITENIKSELLVFNVNQFSIYFKELSRVANIPEIADLCDIKYKQINKDAIIIDSKHLHTLNDASTHYNFSMLHWNDKYDYSFLELVENIDQNYLLNSVESDFYLTTHDDCYIYLESREYSFVKKIICTFLSNLVMSQDWYDGQVVTFDESIFEILTDNQEIAITNQCKFNNNKISWEIIKEGLVVGYLIASIKHREIHFTADYLKESSQRS